MEAEDRKVIDDNTVDENTNIDDLKGIVTEDTSTEHGVNKLCLQTDVITNLCLLGTVNNIFSSSIF